MTWMLNVSRNLFCIQGSSYKEWLLQQEAKRQALHCKLEICEAEKIEIDKRAENRRLVRQLHAQRQEAETKERIVQVSI
jgi:hypothetical protein